MRGGEQSARVPDALQRSSRCCAEPGPYQTPACVTAPALQRTAPPGYALRCARGTPAPFLLCIALRSMKVLPPFILWASGASLIWITTASASTPRFFTSACVMSRIIPAFCSSVRPAAMLTVISGIVCSLSLFVVAGLVPAIHVLGRLHYQDVDARDKPRASRPIGRGPSPSPHT